MMPVGTRGNTNFNIDHIIKVCGFPDDPTITELIRTEGWTVSSEIATFTMAEVNDFKSVKDDSSYMAKPMAQDLCKCKGFFLLFTPKYRELLSNLDEEDVTSIITKSLFYLYCGSPHYHLDHQKGLAPPIVMMTVPEIADVLTAREFRKSLRRDKGKYMDLKEDKHFNSLNR
jgi:hypothetical protein